VSVEKTRQRSWLVAAAALLPIGVVVGVSARAAPEAGFGHLLAVSGPRVLLALAVGVGLGAAAGVTGPGPAARRRELLLLGLAFGGAAGGTRAVAAGWLGPHLDLPLGALGGAAGGASILWALDRSGAAAALLTSLALLALLGLALVAGVVGRGDFETLRPAVGWLLGDFADATPTGAGVALALVAGLAALTLQSAGDGPPGERARRRALLLQAASLGAGGLVAGFAWLVAWVGRAVGGAPHGRSQVLLCAALGGTGMLAAEVLPRVLVGGYAPSSGVAVAMVAIPWLLLSGSGRSAAAPRALRAVEVVTAFAISAVFAGAVWILVRVVGAIG
jgi:hypothetical protein